MPGLGMGMTMDDFQIAGISHDVAGRENRICVESASSGGMWCEDALRMMTRKIFSTFVERILLSLSSISLLYRSQFSFSGCCWNDVVSG